MAKAHPNSSGTHYPFTPQKKKKRKNAQEWSEDCNKMLNRSNAPDPSTIKHGGPSPIGVDDTGC